MMGLTGRREVNLRDKNGVKISRLKDGGLPISTNNYYLDKCPCRLLTQVLHRGTNFVMRAWPVKSLPLIFDTLHLVD